MYFTLELLGNIIKETNRYANQVMGAAAYLDWEKVTVEELKAYFGFCILMAINHLPSVVHYWRVDPLLRYAPVADRLSRKRFQEIMRFLHFVDNETLIPRGCDGYDRLGNVRPLIEHCTQRYASVYHPNCEVAVDEAMIKFQGRSSLKQYMPLKPVKRGVKVCNYMHEINVWIITPYCSSQVWVLADSCNGYFSKFEVYTGRKGQLSRDWEVEL